VNPVPENSNNKWTPEEDARLKSAGLRRWLTTVPDQIVSGIASPMMSAARSSLWHWRFLSCRRGSWLCASPTSKSTLSRRLSVYRLLKAHDLITSPAYVVIKAANELKTRPQPSTSSGRRT
jgi:hypothetical protein